MIISCARTNLPILGGPDWAGHPFSRVVLLREGRPPAAGWYDGAGSLGGLDLRAAGVLDEIRAGTACLVLGDHYRAGDAPAGLGSSRIETDPERRPDGEFVAACARIGGFATYEGYALARDGKVPPEIGAALTDQDVSRLHLTTTCLRQAIAKRLALLASGSSRSVQEIERLVVPSVGLDVVPLDPGCRRLCLVGGPGVAREELPATFGLADGSAPSPEEMAADLLGRFPPRQKASAVLTDEDGPIGAIALYEAPELGLSVYVCWTQDDIGMFGSVEQAVEAFGLQPGALDLTATMTALKFGRDVTVSLRRDVGRRL